MLIGSIITDPKAVAGITALVTSPFLIVSGAFKNTANLSPWIGWLQYISPFKYGFIAMTEN